jgi:asparagine synthase (glutamine-hydrolysing)
VSAIAGFWSLKGEPARDYCTRMLHAQQPYGSKSAHWANGPFACGRLLHSVLPEDAFDQQPLRRGPYRLVADLRLDNRADLAAGIGLSSEQLARCSDADVLFECLLKWGDAAIERLIGEFAFALWNDAEQRLLLGRDLFGLRPLHFHRSADFFAFSTMPSGLHALPALPREFDAEAMADELALLSADGSRTLYRGIERVLPGHLVQVTRGTVSTHAFWAPPEPGKHLKPAEYEEGLRAVVATAVKAQLRGADRTVGSHLSAGLDSSIVTATAAQLFAPGKVLAFTATPRKGFDGPTPGGTIGDESALAAQTAAQFPNVEHIVVDRSEETLVDVLNRQFAYMQQPANGLCNSLWSREISRCARARGLKVLLVGFSGNLTVTYSGREAWSALLKRGRLLKLLGIGARMAAKGVPLRSLGAQLIGPILPPSVWAQACRAYGRPTNLSGYTAISPVLRNSVEARARSRGVDLLYQPSNDPLQHRLDALFDGDNGNYFKGILAEFGLSMRDPLSDKRVVEYCLGVPAEEYLRGGTERGLARRAFADRLPPSVAESHVRGLQGADWYESVARDMPLLRQELEVIKRCAAAAEVLDTGWIDETLASWPQSEWDRRDVILRYRYGLLRGVSAGHFMRKLAGTN